MAVRKNFKLLKYEFIILIILKHVVWRFRIYLNINQSGSCSRCESQRCGFCEIGILVETNKFCTFTVRFKYRIFRPLNCISVNVIYKIDCILCKLSYIGSTSKQARTRWVKCKYDIKNSRIEQSGLTDHLHKRVHHNQSFEQKLGNLRMVLIDQVVGEIIVNNVCVLCELEETWINRLQTHKELNYYNDYILNWGCPHKPKAK